eukprot:m.485343 g.485343  ORF g.485343 m.485343 type:complete len:981 (+) comp23775_c0_seq1:177-3119(+)
MALLVWLAMMLGVWAAGCVGVAGHGQEEKQPLEPLLFDHHTHDQMTALLHHYNASFADKTELFSIGKSVDGRDLWVMRITGDLNPQPGRPRFKYIGNMHGNEVVGRQMLIYLVQTLLDKYDDDDDPDIRRLVDSTDIYIMPTLNPDGHARSLEHAGACGGLGLRENVNHVDLNRDFPDQFFPDASHEPQPETRAVMDWLQSTDFVLGANLHGGSLVASYPFDGNLENEAKATPCPDDAVFRLIASRYAVNHADMATTGIVCSRDEFQGGIANGASWYPLYGSLQDWSYLTTSSFDITLELGCCRFPEANKLASFWDKNGDALLALIDYVHTGVKGFVRSQDTGEGIQGASISVAGIDHIVFASEFGDYWRLLAPGVYNMTAQAQGFDALTREVAIPNTYAAVPADFDLVPQAVLGSEKTAAAADTATPKTETATAAATPTSTGTQTTTPTGMQPTDTATATAAPTSPTTTAGPKSTAASDTPTTPSTAATTVVDTTESVTASPTPDTHPTGVVRASCPIADEVRFEYRSQSGLQDWLKLLQFHFPTLVDVSVLGRSINGKPIHAVRLTKDVASEHPDRPKVLFVGNVHGNEAVGRELLVYLVSHLACEADVDDAGMVQLLASTQLFIVPTLNPDGFAQASRHEGECESNVGRSNANHVDLELDYDGHNQQPETKALATWVGQQRFSLALVLQASSLVVTYPPNTGQSSALDDQAVFELLGQTYASKHPEMVVGSPTCGDSKGYQNGLVMGRKRTGAPSPSATTLGDWFYTSTDVLGLTARVSCCPFPFSRDLPDLWRLNKPGLLSFAAAVHDVPVLTGKVVRAAGKGKTVPVSGAVVTVKGRPSHQVHANDAGQFWRLLEPGEHTLAVSGPGLAVVSVTAAVPLPAGTTEPPLTVKLKANTTDAEPSSSTGKLLPMAVLAMIVLVPLLSYGTYKWCTRRRHKANVYAVLADKDFEDMSFSKLSQEERSMFSDSDSEDDII